MPESMLTDDEQVFIDLVLEVGDRVLEQDTVGFMIEKGVRADSFMDFPREYTLWEVLESLDEKDLVYTETKEESIHYNGRVILDDDAEAMRWEDTGFKVADRQYIYFTEKLGEYLKERGLDR